MFDLSFSVVPHVPPTLPNFLFQIINKYTALDTVMRCVSL